LAEIIEGFLSTRPTGSDKSEMEFYLNEYNSIIREISDIKKKKDALVNSRNQLDKLEQKYCLVREHIDWCFDFINEEERGKIWIAAEEFEFSYHRSKKEEQGLLIKLFWPFIGRKRIAKTQLSVEKYNSYAERYKLPLAGIDLSLNDTEAVVSNSKKFDDALAVALDYKTFLQSFSSGESLENYDKKLSDNKSKLSDIAFKLWDKWLLSQAVSFSPGERQEMANFVAAMKLSGDIDLLDNPALKKKFSQMTKQMTKYLQ